jgi:acyl-CoA thioester hydrolase
MAQAFVTERLVEFCETDAAGIAHFANFFLYMEQAEHAFLRSLGTSVMLPEEDGWRLSWPRVHAKCDFLGTVQFEEQLRICLQIERLGEKSVTYRFDFFSPSNRLIARGTLIAVCCRMQSENSLIESIRIPETLRRLLEGFVIAQ